MYKLAFDLGESRHIRLLVKSAEDKPFNVRTATWELIKDGEIESQGDCSIIDHILDAFITPTAKGTYRLRFIYHIADETLIEVVEVAVV